MKITLPSYYREFRCIDRECEDTCCAGWEVDVDEEKYQYYKTVKGNIGKRLEDVMIPKEKGEGCSFRLKENKRCPFLNEENLCDLYIELGEESLCETCTCFPRFINDYGATREIGLAPSCFTAAQIMVGRSDPSTLEISEYRSLNINPNDIDPDLYFRLRIFRKDTFEILWNRDISLNERLMQILLKAEELEKSLFEDEEYYNALHLGDYTDIGKAATEPFEGMEVVNPGSWLEVVGESASFFNSLSDTEVLCDWYIRFEKENEIWQQAFEQLIFYYLYRYILEAVYDCEIVNAVRIGIVAYISTKRLCVAKFAIQGSISPDEIADIFHLYSRYLEHSEINFEYYMEQYRSSYIYSVENILADLKLF
ncbi:MAG: flagellin lysine-N-methylase [Clostridiales bacterium]|nr:flagellin lysine-N-methylase [Clostridiales bacterium]MBS5877999.1 flagellin lysine-N-methylase [Clostridiales bacterium]MDU0939893.1 flagellin lysine-N-methylase [Clostridiales bacterium]MDU1042425.1 flagellin lysine-N-methylase [Clostridiales bacterium]MDU3489887.1 flagellin lysine-N-methylase [Clostridiales bacterium]